MSWSLISLLLSLIFLINISSAMELNKKSSYTYATTVIDKSMCEKLAENPYFESEMVIGGIWKIFYYKQQSHTITTYNECSKLVNLRFAKSTPEIVTTFQNDMEEYVETQPTWDAATLLIILEPPNYEALLFADQGPAGKFFVLPNLVKANSIAPEKEPHPLIEFQLKLMDQGRFLLMSDCRLGEMMVAAREDIKPSEIKTLVSTLDLGEGVTICKPNETVFNSVEI